MFDPVPTFALQVLELFDGPLRDVRFPEATGDLLVAAAEDVRSAQAAVDAAGEALSAARARLDEKQRALQHRSERALAYARIYAEDVAELRARLETITPPTTRGSGRRGPGRPPRETTNDLFAETRLAGANAAATPDAGATSDAASADPVPTQAPAPVDRSPEPDAGAAETETHVPTVVTVMEEPKRRRGRRTSATDDRGEPTRVIDTTGDATDPIATADMVDERAAE
jgi:hypothetical protein